MNKVRAYWGHNYHFHVRITCPEGDAGCQAQNPLPPGDGCDKSLDWWFTDEALHPRAEFGESTAADGAAARMPKGRSGETTSHAFGVAAREARVAAE